MNLDAAIQAAVAAAVRAEIEPLLKGLENSRPEPLLDDAGMCALLGISRPTLRKLLTEGMPYVQVVDVRRYERGAVLAWARRGGKAA